MPERHVAQRLLLNTWADGGSVRTTTKQRGTVCELLVAADLLERGFHVFVPVTRHIGACDLITLAPDGKVERIEVKRGKKTKHGTRYAKPTPRTFDRLAVVVPGEPIRYQPPLDRRAR